MKDFRKQATKASVIS